jgi:hypothetical protein
MIGSALTIGSRDGQDNVCWRKSKALDQQNPLEGRSILSLRK